MEPVSSAFKKANLTDLSWVTFGGVVSETRHPHLYQQTFRWEIRVDWGGEMKLFIIIPEKTWYISLCKIYYYFL